MGSRDKESAIGEGLEHVDAVDKPEVFLLAVPTGTLRRRLHSWAGIVLRTSSPAFQLAVTEGSDSAVDQIGTAPAYHTATGCQTKLSDMTSATRSSFCR